MGSRHASHGVCGDREGVGCPGSRHRTWKSTIGGGRTCATCFVVITAAVTIAAWIESDSARLVHSPPRRAARPDSMSANMNASG
jgi:hypothetical protein